MWGNDLSHVAYTQVEGSCGNEAELLKMAVERIERQVRAWEK